MKRIKGLSIVGWIVFVCLVYVILMGLFSTDVVKNRPDIPYDLGKDGACLLSQVLTEVDLERLKDYCEEGNYKDAKHYLLHKEDLKQRIQQILNDDYQFQDYIWIIQKSSVHTCHRDNNGDFFNEGQQYPSYTLLIYIEDMDKCLGIIPESHTGLHHSNLNLTSRVETLLCRKGDAILFNANLIHVGTIQDKDHLRIQMKVTHRDDLDVLSYYQDFNKVLKKDNVLPKNLLQFQKNISCMFPYVSNLSQRENIQSARGTDNGETVGMGQKIFSWLFYGNSDFYDLPNAF